MGRLIGIARINERGGEPILLHDSTIRIADGVMGDPRGHSPRRQVTLLFREGWEAACREIGRELPWTARRANLYAESMPVPPLNARLAIGNVILQVKFETVPCYKMDYAHPGLKEALRPGMRGGVCCSVLVPGQIRTGDSIAVLA